MRKKIAFNVGASIGTSIAELKEYDVIYAFEPTPFSFKKLIEETKNQDRVKCYQLAISEEDGRTNFNCHTHYEYSSLLSIDTDSEFVKKCNEIDPGFEEIYDIIEVETKRLDTFLIQNKITHIDFLKIDTQGSDLSVVKSLGESIRKVDLIELEVQNISLYKNSPSKEETVEYLNSKGFKLIEEIWNAEDLVGFEQRLSFRRDSIRYEVDCHRPGSSHQEIIECREVTFVEGSILFWTRTNEETNQLIAAFPSPYTIITLIKD
jgi:FkbM family methyltransferase